MVMMMHADIEGTDKSAEVRKVVVGFIEEACKKKPALFSRAADTLSFLMADDKAGDNAHRSCCLHMFEGH